MNNDHNLRPMDTQIPNIAGKGRGAVSNQTGRFEGYEAMAIDDGWNSPLDEDLPPLRTTVTPDATRTIIARNTSPDVPFDRSINPYRGCEHGCVYCFARPTHAFLGLSPGLDFETRLFYKPEAAALLEKELRSPKYTCGVMAAPMIPVLTDPELESILEAAKAADAHMAGYVLLRLPLEIKELFREWLDAHVPLKASMS